MELDEVLRWERRIEYERSELKRQEAKAVQLAQESSTWEARAKIAQQSYHLCAAAVSAKMLKLHGNPSAASSFLVNASKLLHSRRGELESCSVGHLRSSVQHQDQLILLKKGGIRIDFMNAQVDAAKEASKRRAEELHLESAVERLSTKSREEDGAQDRVEDRVEERVEVDVLPRDSDQPYSSPAAIGFTTRPHIVAAWQEGESGKRAPLEPFERGNGGSGAGRASVGACDMSSLKARIADVVATKDVDKHQVEFRFALSAQDAVAVRIERRNDRSLAVTLTGFSPHTRFQLLAVKNEITQVLRATAKEPTEVHVSVHTTKAVSSERRMYAR